MDHNMSFYLLASKSQFGNTPFNTINIGHHAILKLLTNTK